MWIESAKRTENSSCMLSIAYFVRNLFLLKIWQQKKEEQQPEQSFIRTLEYVLVVKKFSQNVNYWFIQIIAKPWKLTAYFMRCRFCFATLYYTSHICLQSIIFCANCGSRKISGNDVGWLYSGLFQYWILVYFPLNETTVLWSIWALYFRLHQSSRLAFGLLKYWILVYI